MTSRFASWLAGLSTEEWRLFFVAEIANSHEGSLDTALDLVRTAHEVGADAVKFQRFTAAELLVPGHRMYETFEKLEIPPEGWTTLVDDSRTRGLDVFFDVFGEESAEKAIALSPTGIKIHASDMPNMSLIELVGSSRLPVLLSTGGVTWIEIASALDTLANAGSGPVVLVDGIQRYPTLIEDSNLQRITSLRRKFVLPVGYADHVDGASNDALYLPFMAAAAGARLIEKHITLDRSTQGTDYYSSLNPSDFSLLVRMSSQMRQAIGAGELSLSEAAKAYRGDVMKSAVASRRIEPGVPLSHEDVTYKRVDFDSSFTTGIEAIGRTAKHPISLNSPIRPSDLDATIYASLACRTGSARLYAKPLQRVGDRPIIKHLIDRLDQISRLDGTVLAISEGDDNLAFVELAREWGLQFVIGDEDDVLGRHIEAADSVGADIIVRVTTENPFVHQEIVDGLIEHHQTTGADLTVSEMLPDGAYAEVINVSALKMAHRVGEDRHRSELCSLFLFENPDMFRIERVQAPPELARPDIRLTIDTPEDLILARTVFAALEPEFGPSPPLGAIIKFLDQRPDLLSLVSHLTTTKLWR
jgi:N,N'-diacetyllegionaminate synthase